MFKPVTHNSVYCSDVCRPRMNRVRCRPRYEHPRICRECRREFKGQYNQALCSKRCRDTFRNREKFAPDSIQLPTASVGAISELRVAADLLAKGYEVFRAVSAACSCDLVVMKNGITLRIEVRSSFRIPTTGKISRPKSSRDAGRQDVFAFCLSDGEIVYEPPLPYAV